MRSMRSAGHATTIIMVDPSFASLRAPDAATSRVRSAARRFWGKAVLGACVGLAASLMVRPALSAQPTVVAHADLAARNAAEATMPVLGPVPPPAAPTPDVEAAAPSVPMWVMLGIAMRETRSYIGDGGALVYVDRRNGLAGERGPFQVRPRTFNEVRDPGDRFEDLSTDMALAWRTTERILLRLKARNASWIDVLAKYNAGASAKPAGMAAGRTYANAVRALGMRAAAAEEDRAIAVEVERLAAQSPFVDPAALAAALRSAPRPIVE